MSLDVDYVRKQFPALKQEVKGKKAAFFDAPGGTQVPERVIEAMNNYLIESNANKGGPFKTSRLSDRKISQAREALADFLGAAKDEIAFGENMTTLNYRLAFALGRELEEGDEVLISRLDHEANRQPWLDLEEQGVKVREIDVDPATCRLRWQDFLDKLNEKTAVVAVTHASNAVGTIPPVKKIVEKAEEVGALTVIDAVHYALHGPVDVKKVGCDFLLCSTYKFFGPHLGVLYGRREAFEKLDTYRLRPQSDEVPYRIERGTMNHEGIAGAEATISFIAELGSKFSSGAGAEYDGASRRRQNVVAAMELIDEYETPMAEWLSDKLKGLAGVKVYRPPSDTPATSTISFTMAGITPRQVAEKLGERGLFVWDGDFYATTLIERLGLSDSGGLVRIGLAPYNTETEVERLYAAIEEINSGV